MTNYRKHFRGASLILLFVAGLPLWTAFFGSIMDGATNYHYLLFAVLVNLAFLLVAVTSSAGRIGKTVLSGTVNGQIVDLRNKRKLFQPPIYDNGRTVPAEIWWGLKNYKTVDQDNNKLTLFQIVSYSLFSQNMLRPEKVSAGRFALGNPQTYDNFVLENQTEGLFDYQQEFLNLKEERSRVENGYSTFKTMFKDNLDAYVRKSIFNTTSSVVALSLFASLFLGLSIWLGYWEPGFTQTFFSMVASTLGFITGFVGLIYARKDYMFDVLNEEATRIVLDGLAFQNYFVSSSRTSNYSLEGKDSSGLFMPWSIAFRNERTWERVFSEREEPGYVVNGVHYQDYLTYTSENVKQIIAKATSLAKKATMFSR